MKTKQALVLSIVSAEGKVRIQDLVRTTGMGRREVHNALNKLRYRDAIQVEKIGADFWYSEPTDHSLQPTLPLVEYALRNAHPLHTVWGN